MAKNLPLAKERLARLAGGASSPAARPAKVRKIEQPREESEPTETPAEKPKKKAKKKSGSGLSS